MYRTVTLAESLSAQYDRINAHLPESLGWTVFPFAVEYVGSLTDLHGRYTATASTETRGRMTLTNGAGVTLRHVRPSSVHVLTDRWA